MKRVMRKIKAELSKLSNVYTVDVEPVLRVVVHVQTGVGRVAVYKKECEIRAQYGNKCDIEFNIIVGM